MTIKGKGEGYDERFAAVLMYLDLKDMKKVDRLSGGIFQSELPEESETTDIQI